MLRPPRPTRHLTALLLMAAMLGSWALPAPAAAAAPASAPMGYLRLAHLSPDTPSVDVYVSGVADPSLSFVLPGVGYGAVSPYKAVPAGSYVVSMRGAGAPADSPPVLSLTVRVDPGSAYTVAGVGKFADLGLSLIVDDLAMPAPARPGCGLSTRRLSYPASTSRWAAVLCWRPASRLPRPPSTGPARSATGCCT